jgi:hypothetical protein
MNVKNEPEFLVSMLIKHLISCLYTIILKVVEYFSRKLH